MDYAYKATPEVPELGEIGRSLFLNGKDTADVTIVLAPTNVRYMRYRLAVFVCVYLCSGMVCKHS